MSRGTFPTLREVSNINNPIGLDKAPVSSRIHLTAPTLNSARSGSSSTPRNSGVLSPQCDRRNRNDPLHCTDVINEIVEMFLQCERNITRPSNYLTMQSEVNEKMRMILIDWLVDVHLKFRLHHETFFLAVDILDRYLATSRSTRQTLQLVGITSILIAAKYEEIFPPEVRDCIHISANTYTRDEILKMERSICSALNFKFTTPTPYPFLIRLHTVSMADDALRHLSLFFLDQSALDYKLLQYLPSQIANAAMFLANIALKREPWSSVLQHYSHATASSFRACAEALLQFLQIAATTKYQAVRRKYSAASYGNVVGMASGIELPPSSE